MKKLIVLFVLLGLLVGCGGGSGREQSGRMELASSQVIDLNGLNGIRVFVLRDAVTGAEYLVVPSSGVALMQ